MKKLFLTITAIFFITAPVYSHGGEDHGNEKTEKVINSNQENIIKVYYLDNKGKEKMIVLNNNKWQKKFVYVSNIRKEKLKKIIKINDK